MIDLSSFINAGSLLDMTALSHAFSSNMYASALVMILLNVGTSFLMQDLMPVAQRIFSIVWVRRLVFFAIFFTATRDLKVSILLMIVFTLLVDVFLNEGSMYCLIPYAQRLSTQTHPSPSSQENQRTHTADIPHSSPQSPVSLETEQQMLPPHHNMSAAASTGAAEHFHVGRLVVPSAPISRYDRFRHNARQWSLSRRPFSYW